MELKFIELNTSLIRQLDKIEEEKDEFVEALANIDNENLIEEFWDVVQAMMGVIDRRGVSIEELMKGREEHYNKLESRGHIFK